MSFGCNVRFLKCLALLQNYSDISIYVNYNITIPKNQVFFEKNHKKLIFFVNFCGNIAVFPSLLCLMRLGEYTLCRDGGRW